ncbi:MAG: protein kinase domain-containing protein [Bdellovibrionales bacterium]
MSTAKKPELFGKYLLLEKLAMGGMAEVFLAKTSGVQGIGKFLAMKRILPQYSSNEEFIQMFTEEAKICVNLSHSNIAKIYEFGIEMGQFYIVMELIEGKNLRQVLSRLGKEKRPGFSVDQAVYIAKEVASGLDNAHRCLDDSSGKPLNIIHRDMSPQNIMVSFEGEIKVVDFGIAKAEGEKEETKAGTLKGKFSYMSPEQASGEKIDSRTDVFSLGIVLWELLANKRLFTSSSEMNTLKKIREGKIPAISKINPNVPEELERIVNIALAKDANNRYQTCAEFYKDLNRFLNRFYPDFSSHDFSIFVKSLYADEVLSNRKKFVEYSKLSKSFDFSKNDTQADKTRVSGGTGTGTGTDFDPLAPTGSSGEVSFDFNALRVEGTNVTNINQTASISSQSGPSTIKKVQRNDLFSPANLSIIGIFIVAIALITSQLMPSETNVEYALEQPSVESSKLSQTLNAHNIIVSSAPSGAEIYVNGKNTGQLTPGRVSVPAKNEFVIGLKKDGFLSYKSKLVSRGNGAKEEFTLQRLNIGYLDITTKYKDTVIYINGRKLRERAPIKNYRVPSSRTLTIKAVDRLRKLYVEKVVTVKPDKKITLTLDPTIPL